jgi:mono/diheme cytochrome c family protein
VSSPGGPVAAASQTITPTSTAAAPADSHRKVLDTYCVTCHNSRLKTAGVALDAIDVAKVPEGAEVWEKVVRKLRAGAMPPPGRPRPDQATYDAFASYLETSLDRSAEARPNPGRTETFHRLNRSEYQNAIRDLLAVDVDVSALLPADAADEHGFDNMAGVLSVSPALLERYISVARTISRRALGLPPGLAIETYTVPLNLMQDDRVSEELPFGSRGGLAVRHNFPVDGEYAIKIRLQTNYVGYARGLDEAHRIELRLDGVRVREFPIGGGAPGSPAPASYEGNIFGAPEWENYMQHADEGLEVRIPVKAGPHVVAVAFPRELWHPEGVLQPRQSGFALAINADPDGNPALGGIDIAGPYAVSGPGDTPSRRRILSCVPKTAAAEEACAKQILTKLARRAYRRTVTDADLQTLLDFYKDGRREGGFENGLQVAMERILAAPDFLFRIERDPVNAAPGTLYRISDLELASRLSFFLWSSIPDDELLDAALKQKLKDPKVLRLQVRRMLADPRSKALVDNFVGQWLYLRNIRTVIPDPGEYPEFDDSLREAFERETALFVESQIVEDRSVVELLSANYTFVNERLARHYGIPGVYGSRFRKVTLPSPEQRGGLLGHGSLLTVTSYPNRTSPVLRGKFLLENILGAPTPPPPPDVPSLPERGEGGKAASVRDRLEMHRKNPVCSVCHSQMDPLGFALENFDAIGSWRTIGEGSSPIDASASLPSGTKFSGLEGLRSVLLSRRDQFVRTVTEKLLMYALGRPVEYYDLPVTRKVVRDAAPNDYRWSAIVEGVVTSAPFQLRISDPGESQPPAATVASTR